MEGRKRKKREIWKGFWGAGGFDLKRWGVRRSRRRREEKKGLMNE